MMRREMICKSYGIEIKRMIMLDDQINSTALITKSIQNVLHVKSLVYTQLKNFCTNENLKLIRTHKFWIKWMRVYNRKNVLTRWNFFVYIDLPSIRALLNCNWLLFARYFWKMALHLFCYKMHKISWYYYTFWYKTQIKCVLIIWTSLIINKTRISM